MSQEMNLQYCLQSKCEDSAIEVNCSPSRNHLEQFFFEYLQLYWAFIALRRTPYKAKGKHEREVKRLLLEFRNCRLGHPVLHQDLAASKASSSLGKIQRQSASLLFKNNKYVVVEQKLAECEILELQIEMIGN